MPLLSEPEEYKQMLQKATSEGVSLTSATRAGALATCWKARMFDVVDTMFKDQKIVTPVEVFAATRILDAPRKANQLRKKMGVWEKRPKFDPNCRKAQLLRMKINEADAQCQGLKGSVSGAFARRVARWCRTIPPETLEFTLLQLPLENWRALADICHLKATDFSLPYFLSVCYGGEAPQGSFIATARALTAENLAGSINFNPRLAEFYSFIRTKLPPAKEMYPNDAKAALARHAPLEDVLWRWEELSCPEADAIVKGRLEADKNLHSVRGRSNYGKLMERILTLRSANTGFWRQLMPFAEMRLEQLKQFVLDDKIKLEEEEGEGKDEEGGVAAGGSGAEDVSDALASKLQLSAAAASTATEEVTPATASPFTAAILGDCSSSMDVAVRSATIVGSLLSACLQAELVFFNGNVQRPTIQPRGAEEVLSVVDEIRATGCTSPAAALWPFYENKQRVDIFVVVTDEEENTEFKGNNFSALFQMYRNEVYSDAKLIFVSFLRQGDEGQMVKTLNVYGVGDIPQFRFDPRCPDLNKFDALLTLIKAVKEGKDDVRKLLMRTQQQQREDVEGGGGAAAAAAGGRGARVARGGRGCGARSVRNTRPRGGNNNNNAGRGGRGRRGGRGGRGRRGH